MLIPKSMSSLSLFVMFLVVDYLFVVFISWCCIFELYLCLDVEYPCRQAVGVENLNLKEITNLDKFGF